MTRHRTTYITDDDGKVEHGSYVVEPIPATERVQEFRVRIVTDSTWNPVTASGVDAVLNGRKAFVQDNVTIVTVTEVDPT